MQSWVIDIALDVLGLSAVQKQQVVAAIPQVDDMISLINQNAALIEQARPVIDQLLRDWETVGPALQIVLDALARNKMTLSLLVNEIDAAAVEGNQ